MSASTKRAFKDVNVGEEEESTALKKTKMTSASAKSSRMEDDVNTIKSIIGDIKDPAIKAALRNIIKNPPTGINNAATSATTAAVAPKKSEAALEKMTKQTIRTIQQCMNEKLKWKNSFRNLKDGNTKGGRVEVVCSDPEVFERIFDGAPIKYGKDGKLSFSMQTEEEASKCELPFKGKSYRYNSSVLRAPYSASWKNDTLTFSYKFTVW